MSKKILNDKVAHNITLSIVLVFIFIMICLVGSLLWKSKESISHSKLAFLYKSTWNTRILEVSRIRFDKNSSFLLEFTVPLKEQNFSNLIEVFYNNQKIPVSLQLSNQVLIISPEDILSGRYKITISKNLKDINNYSLQQDIEWLGDFNSNTQLITDSSIKGSVIGIFSTISSDENHRHFTALPFILGTLWTSLLALLIAFPVALSVAIFVTEYSSKNPLSKIFVILIDLLAGIPSVIYGMWGLFFIVPRYGANLLSASLVLSIMILPYAASLSREAISLVPSKIKQAGLGLGASKFRVILHIILPHAFSGIVAGVLLTLGRALGETLAVTMVIGNRNQIPTSIWDPAQTISSLIANEYGESSGLKQSALIEAALVLMIIVLLFSLIGRIIIRRASQNTR